MVIGNYTVGSGKDFLKSIKQACEDNNSWPLLPSVYYVINAAGKIKGAYINEHFAIELARGLDLKDRRDIDLIVDNILRKSDV